MAGREDSLGKGADWQAAVVYKNDKLNEYKKYLSMLQYIAVISWQEASLGSWRARLTLRIMAGSTKEVSVRMEADLKAQGDELFNEYDMNLTTAFNIFVC